MEGPVSSQLKISALLSVLAMSAYVLLGGDALGLPARPDSPLATQDPAAALQIWTGASASLSE